MKIKFLGATGTVTGSKYLLEAVGGMLLVDCGMFQGPKNLRQKNWNNFPVNPANLKAVVLTHAHIDHSGYLPKLVREGFKGPIFCTRPTATLCKILLMDSAKLMEEEARYANKKGFSRHKPAVPLFTVDDAERTLSQIRPLDFGMEHELPFGLLCHFRHTGHILGAASVKIWNQSTSITFSGDVGRMNDPMMLTPEAIEATNYLVVESTYGDRQHRPTDPLADLRRVFQETWSRGGSVLIPAFAVGRAQQILFHIGELKKRGEMPDFRVYLDSPMAVDATDLFCEFSKDHKLSMEECERTCKSAKYIRSIEESKALQKSSEQKVVISASGMATGGRVLHYLKTALPDTKNTVLFAGYQAAGTRGAALVNGAKEVKIHGELFPVRAHIENIENLSAHADASEVIDWLERSKISPIKVFITHGEPKGSEAMRVKLFERFHWTCVVPKENEEYKI
ncbi:MAG: mRNA 3'-end processing factor [Proteobacteria bacterium SG_bin7]|nr:MAG: mRNA 3'-end processing factor [Proteobacteria bacterium SG_bin7]